MSELVQQTTFSFSSATDEPITIKLRDAVLRYYAQAFSIDESDHYLHYCLNTLSWRQDSIRIAGRSVPIPRLQNWYGEQNAGYAYAGLALVPLPWPTGILEIREKTEALCDHNFNAVLANLYRNGTDSVAWHSDDERELGPQPVIASVSFGATRVFEMKHLHHKREKTLRLPLTHGSLLLMTQGTQAFWQHQIPKEPSVSQPRVNLTFRRILPFSTELITHHD